MTTNAADCAGTIQFEEAEKAAACSVTGRIDAAWNANDAVAFAAVFADNGSMVLSGDRYFRGREEILKALTESFTTDHKGTSLIQNIVDFKPLTAASAVITTEGGVLAPGETEVHPQRALRATWVVTKVNGEWLLAAYQNGRRADGKLQTS